MEMVNMAGVKVFLLAVLVPQLALCQLTGSPPTGIPDIDWGDLLHPPRMALKYRRGEHTWITTHGTKNYDGAWYSVEDRNSMVFSVRACSHACIVLSDDLGTTDFSVEIEIGHYDNRQTSIKYAFEQNYMFSQHTPHVLHCNEYRTFWLKWGADIIALGKGPVIGEEKLINYFHRPADWFVAIGLASDYGNSASWRIQENAGDYLELHTPSVHRYTNLWKQVEQRRFFTFAVRACGHAHILLSENLGDQENNFYEIVIGGWDNTRSGIRKTVRGSLLAEHNEDNILTCDGRRDFWIGWANDTIEVGKGQRYGHHRFLRYHDRTSPVQVRFLALTTGFGAEGWWLMDDYLGSTNVIITPKAEMSSNNEKYNSTVIESNHRKWATFSVATCSEASILLSDSLDRDMELGYEIVLGYNGNYKSGIRNPIETGWFVEIDTPNILDCVTLTHFWISWANHTVRVGRGFVFGFAELMRTPLPADLAISAFAFATPDQDGGVWRVRDYFGERIVLNTPDVYGVNYMWRLIPNHDSIVFRVNARSDVHITLAPTTGVDRAEPYYDIVIGGWTNTKCQIRKVLYNGEREDESPAVDCALADAYQHFWISWDGNMISLGSQEKEGLNVILQHTFDNWDPPKAVSFSTGYTHKGTFRIHEDQGDEIIFYTNQTDPSYRPTILNINPFVHWKTFYVRTCGGVSIKLYAAPEGNPIFYEVQLCMAGNTEMRVIRYNDINDQTGQRIATTNRNNFCRCEISRTVWVSWGNNKIEAGDGMKRGHNTFISADIESSPVEPAFVSMDTIEGNYGRWRVFHNQATGAEFYTPDNYNYWWFWTSVEHKEFLAFTTNACHDIHVALTDKISFDIWEHTYEIIIAGWENTQSAIRQNRIMRVTVATPDLMWCNGSLPIQNFWVTWAGGTIVVGQGYILGERRIMSYSPVNPPDQIRLAAFSSGYGADAHWTIPLLDAVITPPVTQAPPYRRQPQGLSGGAVAGIVIGCMAIVLIGIVVTLFMMIRMGKLQPHSVPGGSTLQDLNTQVDKVVYSGGDQAAIVDNMDIDNPNYEGNEAGVDVPSSPTSFDATPAISVGDNPLYGSGEDGMDSSA